MSKPNGEGDKEKRNDRPHVGESKIVLLQITCFYNCVQYGQVYPRYLLKF